MTIATAIGDKIGPLEIPPINRLTLALYCGASNDHNAVHVDIDAAREAGFDDVFSHGMLTMAYLGRLLTGLVEPCAIRSFSTRFEGIVNVGERLVCHGEITEKIENKEGSLLKLLLVAETPDGVVKARGEALISQTERKNENT